MTTPPPEVPRTRAPGAPPAYGYPYRPAPPTITLTPVQYAQHIPAVEQAYAAMYSRKPSQAMAITSMVLGIIAVVTCWLPLLSYVAVVLAVLSLVFGLASIRRAHGRGYATAGVILATVGLVGSIAFSVVWTRQFVEAYEVAQECAEQHPGLGPAFDRCVERGGETGRETGRETGDEAGGTRPGTNA